MSEPHKQGQRPITSAGPPPWKMDPPPPYTGPVEPSLVWSEHQLYGQPPAETSVNVDAETQPAESIDSNESSTVESPTSANDQSASGPSIDGITLPDVPKGPDAAKQIKINDLIFRTQVGQFQPSPNSYVKRPIKAPVWRQVIGRAASIRQKMLREEYVQLQERTRSRRNVQAVFSVHNGKSGGKSTLASWLTDNLQKHTGNSWLLADLNESAGGPAARSGIKLTEETFFLQWVVRGVLGGHLTVTHEFATAHFDSHWQLGVGTNKWGIAEYGEGFKLLICDPEDEVKLTRDEYLKVAPQLKSAFGGMVQDTGNGQATPLNDAAFMFCNCPIFTANALNDESLDHLGYTLNRMRRLDFEKANNGLIVINATNEAEHYAEQFAARFDYDPSRVLFVPRNQYLGTTTSNNVVRRDMVTLEVLVSQMRIADRALFQAQEWINRQSALARQAADRQVATQLELPSTQTEVPPSGARHMQAVRD